MELGSLTSTSCTARIWTARVTDPTGGNLAVLESDMEYPSSPGSWGDEGHLPGHLGSLNTICFPSLCSWLLLKIRFYWKEQKKKRHFWQKSESERQTLQTEGLISWPSPLLFLVPRFLCPFPPLPRPEKKELSLPTHAPEIKGATAGGGGRRTLTFVGFLVSFCHGCSLGPLRTKQRGKNGQGQGCTGPATPPLLPPQSLPARSLWLLQGF